MRRPRSCWLFICC